MGALPARRPGTWRLSARSSTIDHWASSVQATCWGARWTGQTLGPLSVAHPLESACKCPVGAFESADNCPVGVLRVLECPVGAGGGFGEGDSGVAGQVGGRGVGRGPLGHQAAEQRGRLGQPGPGPPRVHPGGEQRREHGRQVGPGLASAVSWNAGTSVRPPSATTSSRLAARLVHREPGRLRGRPAHLGERLVGVPRAGQQLLAQPRLPGQLQQLHGYGVLRLGAVAVQQRVELQQLVLGERLARPGDRSTRPGPPRHGRRSATRPSPGARTSPSCSSQVASRSPRPRARRSSSAPSTSVMAPACRTDPRRGTTGRLRAQSPVTRPRSALVAPRCFLASSRRRCEPRVGFVGTPRRRRRGEGAAEQLGQALAGGDPVAVLGAVLGGDDHDGAADQRPRARPARGALGVGERGRGRDVVDQLHPACRVVFTDWPPGPGERENRSTSSPAGMTRPAGSPGPGGTTRSSPGRLTPLAATRWRGRCPSPSAPRPPVVRRTRLVDRRRAGTTRPSRPRRRPGRRTRRPPPSGGTRRPRRSGTARRPAWRSPARPSDRRRRPGGSARSACRALQQRRDGVRRAVRVAGQARRPPTSRSRRA